MSPADDACSYKREIGRMAPAGFFQRGQIEFATRVFTWSAKCPCEQQQQAKGNERKNEEGACHGRSTCALRNLDSASFNARNGNLRLVKAGRTRMEAIAAGFSSIRTRWRRATAQAI